MSRIATLLALALLPAVAAAQSSLSSWLDPSTPRLRPSAPSQLPARWHNPPDRSRDEEFAMGAAVTFTLDATRIVVVRPTGVARVVDAASGKTERLVKLDFRGKAARVVPFGGPTQVATMVVEDTDAELHLLDAATGAVTRLDSMSCDELFPMRSGRLLDSGDAGEVLLTGGCPPRLWTADGSGGVLPPAPALAGAHAAQVALSADGSRMALDTRLPRARRKPDAPVWIRVYETGAPDLTRTAKPGEELAAVRLSDYLYSDFGTHFELMNDGTSLLAQGFAANAAEEAAPPWIGDCPEAPNPAGAPTGIWTFPLGGDGPEPGCIPTLEPQDHFTVGDATGLVLAEGWELPKGRGLENVLTIVRVPGREVVARMKTAWQSVQAAVSPQSDALAVVDQGGHLALVPLP